MAEARNAGDLRYLPTRQIRPNEHNPRLVFRADELQELADSIQNHGVQVPISVFRAGSHYTLIDGERRWRACRMVNRTEIPAIIYPKPTPVQNIVFMFNIHRFRKDWDPLPTAMKLEELKTLIEEGEGKAASEAELSALTGMTRGAIRRCKLIMEIPARDRADILRELEKPESERRFTTDLYVESQRAVRTISQYLPDDADLERPLRLALIDKYKRNVVASVVDMRMVARIARAVRKGVPKTTVRSALKSLVAERSMTIEDAYSRVAWVYELRSIYNQARSLSELLKSIQKTHHADLDSETREALERLGQNIRTVLRGDS